MKFYEKDIEHFLLPNGCEAWGWKTPQPANPDCSKHPYYFNFGDKKNCLYTPINGCITEIFETGDFVVMNKDAIPDESQKEGLIHHDCDMVMIEGDIWTNLLNLTGCMNYYSSLVNQK